MLVATMGWAMSKFERLLVPGSTELPDCQCGAEMRLSRSEPARTSPDTEVRFYECAVCGHEFRMTVWTDAIAPSGVTGGL
jgi:hypothetical protein